MTPEQLAAMELALEALEESLGYVEEEAENAQRLYGQYPTRQARIQGLKDDARKHMNAITAVREALADHIVDANKMVEQPAQQQEPVAWSYWQSCLNDDGTQTAPWVHRVEKFKPSESIINKNIVPLYTSPPKRKPLTHPQIHELDWPDGVPFEDILLFARAIEAAHGIKGEA